jgi:signal peptidase I
MPVRIIVSMLCSAIAVVGIWFSPAVGLAMIGAIVIGGAVLFVTGNRAVGAVVALMPFGVLFLALQLAGLVWLKGYRVPSEAMEPTIRMGDRILVDRHDTSPRVGDIVVFHPPVGSAENECAAPVPETPPAPCARATPQFLAVRFVKRVVAGPGDTVALRRGLVIRNGRAARERYARSCGDTTLCDMPGAITIPAGTWFVLGDNRGASDDSRFWGPVPRRAIIGTVKYRYWPPGRAGRLHR